MDKILQKNLLSLDLRTVECGFKMDTAAGSGG